MPNKYPIDVQPGLRQPGSTQFIRQLVVEKPKLPFCFELPGAVRCSGEAVAHSILPYGRVALAGEPPQSAAMVSAAVIDEKGLDRALDRLTRSIGSVTPLGFAVRLAASKRSFADIVSLAEESVGGCNCTDESQGGAVVRGTISVGLSASARGKLKWTDPVSALIKTRIDDEGCYNPIQLATFVSSWLFDCYSDWEGLFNRRTRCYGSCTGSQLCLCGKNAAGTPLVFCRGWNSCNCV